MKKYRIREEMVLPLMLMLAFFVGLPLTLFCLMQWPVATSLFFFLVSIPLFFEKVPEDKSGAVEQ